MESFSEETKTKNFVSASIIFAVNYLEKNISNELITENVIFSDNDTNCLDRLKTNQRSLLNWMKQNNQQHCDYSNLVILIIELRLAFKLNLARIIIVIDLPNITPV